MINIKEYTDTINEYRAFLSSFLGEEITENKIHKLKTAFDQYYSSRPVVDNSGGSGPIHSFWFFLLVKLFSPELIIESGVWKGHTTWLFRRAAPLSVIHCFDISLNQIVYRDPDAHYHECDWVDFDIESKNARKSLLFFDDHIDQSKRIIEAWKRGFKYLIFDDGVKIDEVERVGIPPFPSVQMLFDENLEFSKDYYYDFNGKQYTYTHDRQLIEKTRPLIKDFIILENTYTAVTLVILS